MSAANILKWYKLGGPFVRHYAFEQDILDFINTFTCDKHGDKIVGDDIVENGKLYLLEKWPKKIKAIENVGRDVVRIHLHTKNKVIAAQRFTNAFTPASELMPTLLSTKRLQHCHSGSLAIARIMPEEEQPVRHGGRADPGQH